MSLKISQKFLIAVTVPVILELVLVCTLLNLLAWSDDAIRREKKSRELASIMYGLMGMHVQRVNQFAIYKSNGDQAMFERMLRTQDRMRQEIPKIRALVASDRANSQQWDQFYEQTQKINEEHALGAAMLAKGDRAGLSASYARLGKQFNHLLQLNDELTAQQAKVGAQSIEEYSDLIRTILYASIPASVILAFGLVFVFNRSTTSRLDAIMQNTRAMTAGNEPRLRLKGDDELAAIDKTYHSMYDALALLRHKERAILGNVADVVCALDADLHFIDINQAALRQWGYEAESFIGAEIAALICPSNRSAVLQELNNAIKKGKGTIFECAVLRADETQSDTEWTVNWSAEDSALYCVVHDISARKELERMKAEFVAMVSHEIRTPLCNIQLTHQLMEAKHGAQLDDFMRKSLTAAQDNVNRLMALVNNLLDIDRLSSGHVEFVRQNESAKEIVETSISAIESLFAQKSIEVKHAIDPSLTVYADRERLIQVLINLLNNAIKYSEQKSRITIKARKDGNFVRFSVSDTGRGIPEDKLSAVFERFRQVEAKDEKVHKGAGLGLAISKAIVEGHKGKIGVDSTLGEGTTFWFTVPSGRG